jgi:hypothetical protein
VALFYADTDATAAVVGRPAATAGMAFRAASSRLRVGHRHGERVDLGAGAGRECCGRRAMGVRGVQYGYLGGVIAAGSGGGKTAVRFCLRHC